MKNLRFIIPFLILAIFFGFAPSCTVAKPEVAEEPEKEYRIIVHSVNWDKVNTLDRAMEYTNITDASKEYLRNSTIRENTHTTEYRAVEIISYSDTNARFITKTGREQFIKADFIEITRIK